MKRSRPTYQPTELDDEHRAAVSLRRSVSIAATELRYKYALEGKSPTSDEIHAAETEAAARWERQRQQADA